EVRIDGRAAALSGRIRWIASEAAFTPYFALTQRDRSRLAYLAEILVEGPQAEGLPAGIPVEVRFPAHTDGRRSGDSCGGTGAPVRRACRGAGSVADHPAAPHLRLPRSERVGQVHDHPDALRALEAERRQRPGARPRGSGAGRVAAPPHRLHDAEVLALRRPGGRGEPDLSRACLRPVRAAAARADRAPAAALRPERPRRA